MQTVYIVTKLHTKGVLADLTTTERTTVKFDVGFVCSKPCVGSGAYKVIAVEVAA